MAKFVATPLASSYGSVSAINANLVALETAIANTVSRDGSSPNAMGASLDMNNNSIINISSLDATNVTVGGQSVVDYIDAGVAGAVSAATAQAAIATSQAGIATTQASDAANSAIASAASAGTAVSLYTITPAGDIASTTVAAAVFELDTDKVPRTSTTGSAILPSGTTAERDGTPAAGYTRFNSTLNQWEGYNGTTWTALGGGATGGAGNYVFMENDQVVTQDYTITAGKNAGSFGDVSIDVGVTVTIPAGGSWTITG